MPSSHPAINGPKLDQWLLEWLFDGPPSVSGLDLAFRVLQQRENGRFPASRSRRSWGSNDLESKAMFTMTTPEVRDQDLGKKTVRHGVSAVCRNLCAIGLMTVLLTACGGGGGGSSGGSAGNANPTGGSGSSAGTGTNTGGSNTGGSNTGDSTGSGGTGGAGGSNTNASELTRPIVYLADQDIYQTDELYLTIPGAAGSSIKLSAPVAAGGYVNEFALMPSGDAVVYKADQNILGRFELFMVNFSNPETSIRLNAPLTTNRDVLDFTVSPDGQKIAYRADMDADDQYELYVVDVQNPGAAVKVNGALAPNGWVRSNYQFSPDSASILYRADGDASDVMELYLVNLAAPGQPEKVNPTLGADRDVYNEFYFTPDGTHIGYIADQTTDEVLELYVVSTDALGTSTKLNGELVANGDVCRFKFSPDSERVAYCADEETDGVIELFTVSLSNPGQSVKLNPTLVAGGRVNSDFVFSADSSFIVYTSEQDVSGLDELFRVDVANPGVSTKLNAPLVSGGDVDFFHLSADNTRVAYVAAQEQTGVWEIFEVDLAQPGVSTKISAPMTYGGVFWFQYAEDDTHIVYIASQESEISHLYEVALDAPGVSTRLNPPLVLGGEVWDFIAP
jgi:Tol biopolymer transport system component